jgi:hypothetical protein
MKNIDYNLLSVSEMRAHLIKRAFINIFEMIVNEKERNVE